mmetsp:Transcript_5205/g.7347  ORF Transcript_5205/g.7347 Transcript_5205/m.7347 type:complete len:256 (-) Transcript_5205:393-1160(-)
MVLHVSVLSIRIMSCVGIVLLDVMLDVMTTSGVIMLVMSLWRWWSLSNGLISSVLLHFHLETDLVFGSHIFVTLLGIRRQCPPAFTKNTSHFNKLDSREFLHDLWTHLVGKEHIRSTSTLGCSRVLRSTLVALTGTVILNHNSTSIMSWRRNVRGNLCIVTAFVLSCPGIPSSFLFRSKILVHVTSVLGKLSKGHTWIFALELFSHGVLVQKISRHVTLRCIGILFRLAFTSFCTWRSNNCITLRIVAGRRYVRS